MRSGTGDPAEKFRSEKNPSALRLPYIHPVCYGFEALSVFAEQNGPFFQSIVPDRALIPVCGQSWTGKGSRIGRGELVCKFYIFQLFSGAVFGV